jgi:lysophospholipase L1-like esterase
MKKYILSVILLAVGTMSRAEQNIAPNDSRIRIEGAMFVRYEDGKAIINRHSDGLWSKENVLISPKNANTQSGVRIVFRTDSKSVKLLFSDREDATRRQPNNFYGIFENGKFIGDMPGADLTLTASAKGATKWEIALPIMYGVDFNGIVIDDGAKLYMEKSVKRPVYVAIGNSITHGAGQMQAGSQISYPYVLAAQKGWYLYNLAVGGSQITPVIAEELKGIEADIITVMWGFNDWNATGDIALLTSRYEQLLAKLRAVQPEAKIYCILPSTAKSEEDGRSKAGVPLSAARDAERRVAESMQQAGDKNIFIICGNEISAVEDLNGNVHFHNEGAQKFGRALASLIE